MSQIQLIGVGSPVVDILARVPEQFLDRVDGEKGGMVLVDASTLDEIIAALPETPEQMPGGSSGNTTFALAEMGVQTTFLGKTGNDSYGAFYRESLARAGGDTSRFLTGSVPNGRCVSLITPDSERTMRTDLGAAMTLRPDEITEEAFTGIPFAHIEGYLLFNPDLILKVLRCARAGGCRISLDLASFEVVQASLASLPDLLRDYIDIVFANGEEAAAFFGETPNPAEHARKLQDFCGIAAVKEGKKGSWICADEGLLKIPPVADVEAVDTTGAGDYWAAGFLAGMVREQPLRTCGNWGSVLGAEIVQRVGAKLPKDAWLRLRETALKT